MDLTVAEGTTTSGALRVILPVIDMANHNHHASCRLAAGPRGVELVAERDHAPGEPILLNYGAR
eukprot:CAMPEP_0118987228 /NCGR_PEP_ID=MMETSP1173-20130426/43770_1 /TAXON_ID=1034831 /ORGANISM="Rhizochromulina marina cf, Strain CCMP1243" /LENGTH=63 /DNA_ID=CAMNT_0006938061 /DNA_START=52 /DNA_END=240 /DNA_ORIENTATION=-